MLDHEARSSISEPFWAEVPMAISGIRRGLQGPSPKEGTLWYCHHSGMISDAPPEQATGGILAEEMGMGKTVEVLGLLALTMTSQRQWQLARAPGQQPRGGTMICCPVSLFGQWKAEIKSKLKKDQQFTIYEYHTGRRFDPEVIAKADIVLTCYSILNREQDGVQLKGQLPFTCPLKNIEFYRVVLDECHVIKEANTKQSKMACSFQTNRRWAVTGTIMQTKHDDIAMLYQFLRMKPFDTITSW
jgi:SNF2 family DNA or RNA helicase